MSCVQSDFRQIVASEVQPSKGCEANELYRVFAIGSHESDQLYIACNAQRIRSRIAGKKKETIIRSYGVGTNYHAAVEKCQFERFERVMSVVMGWSFFSYNMAIMFTEYDRVITSDMLIFGDRSEKKTDRFRDKKRIWTEAFPMGVTNGKKMWVPSSLVYLRYPILPECKERYLPDSAGLAFGVNHEQSITHGLSEVIERDQIMLAWRTHNFPIARVDEDIIPSTLHHIAHQQDLILKPFIVGRPCFSQTLLTLCFDEKTMSRITIGYSCKEYYEEAARHAAEEALMVQLGRKPFTSAYPRNSQEHMDAAYQDRSVLEWFFYRAKHDQLINGKQKNFNDIESIENEYGGMCCYANIYVNNFKYVTRSLVSGAYRRETNHQNILRSHSRLKKYSDDGQNINWRPHPFG